MVTAGCLFCLWVWEGVPVTVSSIQFVFALRALCSVGGAAECCQL